MTPQITRALNFLAGDSPKKRLAFVVGAFCGFVCIVWAATVASNFSHGLDRLIDVATPGTYEHRRDPLIGVLSWISLGCLGFRYIGDQVTYFIRNGADYKNHAIESSRTHNPLHFESPKSALKYACDYLNTRWENGITTVCIVREIKGPVASLLVASPTGPKPSMGYLSRGATDAVAPGDFCAVYIGDMVPQAGIRAMLVTAKLEPSLVNESWKIVRPL